MKKICFIILCVILSLFMITLCGCSNSTNTTHSELASTTKETTRETTSNSDVEFTTEEQTTKKTTKEIKSQQTSKSKKIESKENHKYFGIDLVNKSLNEVIRIMGDDFIVDMGYKTIYYTSPTVCIYNNETLPGFVFYVDDAYEDYEKGKDVKEYFLEGKYKKFNFLGIFDGAAFDSNINSDMKYVEFSEAIGSYKLDLVAGSDAMRQPVIYSDGRKVPSATAYYEFVEEMTIKSVDGYGVYDEEEAKVYNPSIYGIVVFPEK